MSVRDSFRRHGIVKTIPYAFYRGLQRVMWLDITHLMIRSVQPASSNGVSSQEAGFEFRALTANELRNFALDPNCDLDASMAERLSLGLDYCFAVIVEGRLASYCWVALNSIEAKHNNGTRDVRTGVALSFGREYAFRYKGFTHPDFRGRRIYESLGRYTAQILYDLGVRYEVTSGDVFNYGVLRSSERSGFEKMGRVVVAGVGDCVFVRVPKILGHPILVGENAEVVERNNSETRELSLVGLSV